MNKKEKTPNGRDPRDRKLACEKAVEEKEAIAMFSDRSYGSICVELFNLQGIEDKAGKIITELYNETLEQSKVINDLTIKLHNYEHTDNKIDPNRTLPIGS